MLDDLRYACRALRRSPGFAAVAILTVALAVGANTAIFSIADAVLFRPLPYRDPASLFVIQMRNPATGRASTMVRWSHLRTVQDHHRGVGDVATLEPGPTVVAATAAGPEYLRTAAVSSNYFDVFGAEAAHGRLLGGADLTAGGRPAMLSYESWRRRFGGDRRIVGSAVSFGRERYDIVGILSPGYLFPSPIVRRPELIVLHQTWDDGPNQGALYPVVRLTPGTTPEQASEELAVLAAGSAETAQSAGRSVPALVPVRSVLFPAGRPIMRLLLAAALLVLLVGCANLANLFLARLQHRQRDLGVRAALGASRARVLRPLAFEAMVVGLAGSVLALMVTILSIDALLRLVPPIAYGSAAVGVDLRVGAFAIALGSLGAGLFAALVAWRISRLDLIAIIQRRLAGPSSLSRRFGQPMIAVQVAVTLVLVFGAVIAGRAFVSVLQVPLGFDAERVVTIDAATPGATGGRDFYATVLDRLRAHPDVVAAGATSTLPLAGTAMFDSLPGVDGDRRAGVNLVMPGYLETIGVRLVRGRVLDARDLRTASDVIVLSESAVRALLPGREPIGATVQNSSGRRFTVIGVVGDLRIRLDDSDVAAVGYTLPPADVVLTIVARVRTGNEAVLAALRSLAVAAAGGQPVDAAWWSASISDITAYRNPRFQTVVLGGFALLALALTATGVFGLISFLVASRAGELGVRSSLGATPRSLMQLVARQALTPVALGIIGGLVGSRGLAKLAAAQLYDVQTNDPLTLAGTTVVVIVAAGAAAYVPARRARRADPVSLLRAD